LDLPIGDFSIISEKSSTTAAIMCAMADTLPVRDGLRRLRDSLAALEREREEVRQERDRLVREAAAAG
jgi:hypothetical protein